MGKPLSDDLLDEAIQFYSCFISCGHADKSFAGRLHDGLQRPGIRCWLDEHQMLPGDDIYMSGSIGGAFGTRFCSVALKHH